jgi:hypothetical protein
LKSTERMIDAFPKSAEVAEEMYVALCKRFGDGFRPYIDSEADSEAQAISTRHKPEPDPMKRRL